MLKNASLPYCKLINVYKKEYEQVFENKDKDWRKKHDYKNLKDYSYQVNKVDKVDNADKADVTEKLNTED